jgi:predicted acyl esterase
VITGCSSDDRYADDVHYIGGCILACDALSWANTLQVIGARPPDPRSVGECWRDRWLERLDAMPPFIEAWLRHPRRDDYWKQGSVCERYADITCPVFAVGGWEDGYTSAVLRLLEGLRGPRRGLIGPWAHAWPEAGAPGPSIGFLQECLRWWDHWLKDRDSGLMDEPTLRAWMQEALPPASRYAERPGRWVVEPVWPPAPGRERTRSLYLNERGLEAGSAADCAVAIGTVLAHGSEAGVWCSFGAPGDAPTDQRAEDGRARCFDSMPAEAPVEILGVPTVSLTLSADRANAQVTVRLCDVAPDGASLLVSRGVLNLTHRDGHERPSPLEPGRLYSVAVPLKAVAHSLAAGHRWRIAVAPAYWPIVWPSPEPVTLRLVTGRGCRLDLPVRERDDRDDALPDFDEPEGAQALPIEWMRRPERTRELRRDLGTGRQQVEIRFDHGRQRYPDGLEAEGESRELHEIVEGDPLSASVRCEWRTELTRDGWHARIEAQSRMTSSRDHFRVTAGLEACEGRQRVFEREWEMEIPRDHP